MYLFLCKLTYLMHKEKNLCGVAIKHKAVDTLREYMRLIVAVMLDCKGWCLRKSNKAAGVL